MVQVGSLSRRDSVTTTSAADLTVEAASISTASQPPDEDKENQAPGTAGNQEEFGRANTQGSVSKSAVRKRGPQKSWTRTRSGADNSPSVAASRTLISKAQPYSSMPSRTPRRPFASITQTLNSVDPPNLDRYASLPDLRDSSVGSCYSVSSGCASSISSDGRVSRSASSAGHLSPASTTGCGSSSVSSPAGETVSSCYSRSSSIGSGPNLAGIGAGFGLNASMPMQPSPLRNSALGNAGTARGKSGNTGNRLGNVEIDGHGASAGDALRNSAGTANVSAHGGMRSGELAGLGFEDLRLRCEDGCIRMR
ncbi:hypothetical protein OE88DRAFT_1668969 [Heliocybe sulcata]|uniref:Uncharacterized protein n=1 Tax=Heliocybe sulcata TaxID=5364 RepID=A0A5C3MLE1_9AGAM|nr:hypothetical protein OE88DRAFT_1668969 [Heliocybe sulcata]